jgi:hypothetical protein
MYFLDREVDPKYIQLNSDLTLQHHITKAAEMEFAIITGDGCQICRLSGKGMQ